MTEHLKKCLLLPAVASPQVQKRFLLHLDVFKTLIQAEKLITY